MGYWHKSIDFLRKLGAYAITVLILPVHVVRIGWAGFFRALDEAGGQVVAHVLLFSAFGGLLVGIQTGPIMDALGAASTYGWSVAYLYLREVGPILTTLVFLARVVPLWAGQAAAHGGSPSVAAIATRAFSATLALPFLVAAGDVAALAGAAAYGDAVMDVPHSTFLQSLWGGIGPGDVLLGLAKGAAFAYLCTVAALFWIPSPDGSEKSERSAVARGMAASVGVMAVTDWIVTRWWPW